eukprot:6182975-Pleurochrysis_carterae.AAC.1
MNGAGACALTRCSLQGVLFPSRGSSSVFPTQICLSTVLTRVWFVSTVGLLLLGLLRAYDSHTIHTLSTVVLVTFGVTCACTLAGAVLRGSLAAFASNLFPSDPLQYADVAYMLTFIYPCFAGIFQPVNKASDLRTPLTSVPRAAIGSVLTSYAVFGLILCGIAFTKPLAEIDEDDFLLFTWPSKYIGLVGTIIIGMGSCISCLDVAPSMLQKIAVDGMVPGLQWLGLDRTRGEHAEPVRATAFTCLIALPFAWLGSLDAVALATAALFLQMYFTMDVCCLILAALHSPGWRP